MALERLDLPDDIRAAIERLSVEHGMSPVRVVVQAIRLYHDTDERLKRGATCQWSNEATATRPARIVLTQPKDAD